ncbi:hypothetical protein [Streptomyces sp. NPDC050535]|uniref:hypothetical protein n=1 Tax=Streptomyces sp. NPDC050535 TaxID=3365626 RepID=UPI0037917BC3
MFSHLFDSAPPEIAFPSVAACVMLALARVVKNLPQDSINRFFQHRMTKYQIIASDSKGRVAVMQKQRLIFFGFVFTCVAVIALVYISSTENEADAPKPSPPPTTTEAPRPAR